ncbi:MAG: tetratricopeptide repeat protein [Bradyrhizobiaceae bacterium]|nr:tetratricopeptide repeat protein [Bradyrhizobiaceae bacterium]
MVEHQMRALSEIQRDVERAATINNVDKLRSLIEELERHTTKEARAIRHRASGSAYLAVSEYTHAVEHFEYALNLYRDLRDQQAEAHLVRNIGTVYMETGDFQRAIEHYDRALQLFEIAGDKRGEASTCGNIGIVHVRLDDYPSSLTYVERALSIYVEIGEKAGEARAVSSLGTIYFSIGDLERALREYERAIVMHTDIGDAIGAAAAACNIGSVYYRTGDYLHAQEYFTRALRMYEETGHKTGIVIVTGNLCELMLKLGDVVGAEAMLSKQSAMPMNDPEVRSTYYGNLATVSEIKGDQQQAHDHLHSALRTAEESGLRERSADVYRLLRDLALRQNNLQEYVQYNDAFTRITEEIRGREATQKLAMMEADRKIQSERKEREKEKTVLYSTLPKHVADRVIRGETISDHFEHAAVFFSDIVGFTSHSSEMDAPDVVRLLETMFRSFDELCAKHGITKVKTIGDAYLCFKGDEGGSRNAQAVAAFAVELQSATRQWPNGEPLQLRIGLHIGTATAGVIGTDRLQYDVWGDTVNVASRMESSSEPGRIQISEAFANALARTHTQAPSQEEQDTTEDSAQSPAQTTAPTAELTMAFTTTYRGEVDVKGKGMMKTYWLEEALS